MFLVPILKSLTSNDYTVKNSCAFAEEIVEQDSEFFIRSLDVDSLFTNIPLHSLFSNIPLHSLFTNIPLHSLFTNIPLHSLFTVTHVLVNFVITDEIWRFESFFYYPNLNLLNASLLRQLSNNLIKISFEFEWWRPRSPV